MSNVVHQPRCRAALVAAAVVAFAVTICHAGALATSPGARGWPQFRGPWGNGRAAPPGASAAVGLPLEWSESQNVVWKTAIPHRGWSTPVVLGGRVWLTTATPDGHEFFAVGLDAATGRIFFNERLFHAAAPEPLGNPVNSYASPSPVIEPGRVYVHFGSYGTACLDASTGKVLWRRDDLPCRHYRGPASSPILFEDLLILSMDGVDVQYVAALDKETGRTVWRTDRSVEWDDLDANGQPIREGDFRKAFCTPLVVEAAGRTQMISLGAKAAYAYDPRTGKELWRVRHPGHSSAPMPVADGERVYVCTGHGRTRLVAIRLDGRGDVTDTHVAWTHGDDVPLTASPVLADGLLYMVSDGGAVTCLEAATGKPLWRERISGNYAASPVLADGRLYFLSRQGTATVMAAGRAARVLATNRLEDGFMSSPAVVGKALFLRTKTHLYRVEE
jgi:outer membrane protein assembly factor BamB